MAKKPDLTNFQQPLLNPQQQSLQGKAIGGAESILANLLNPSSYIGPAAELNKSLGSQARKDFLGRTVPGIAEQFTNLAPGSQRSSGFTQSLGRAGADVDSNIQSNLGNLIMQLRGQDLGLFGSLMGGAFRPSFDTLTYPTKPTGGQRVGQVAADLAGPAVNFAANAAIGNWPGAIAGALTTLIDRLRNRKGGGIALDESQESPSEQLNESQLRQILSYLMNSQGAQ